MIENSTINYGEYESAMLRFREATTTSETVRVKMSEIWWFAAWVNKAVTWLLIEETDLRIEALNIFWRLNQIKITKQTPVNFGLLMGTTWFYDNNTEYIPDEAPPKWLQSIYNEYNRVKKYKLKNISTPEDLFYDATNMDKCIEALNMLLMRE